MATLSEKKENLCDNKSSNDNVADNKAANQSPSLSCDNSNQEMSVDWSFGLFHLSVFA
jgi:hypothetical protein